ncbi:MAG TPA: MbnP family protein, partial [Flavobacterium sp.]|nr:MbnP family protein [Flavobacterium sp.]
MKKNLLFMACIVMGTTVVSCSNDDNNTPSGTGNLTVEFDNVFGANDLILNTASYSTSQNENLKISQVKYIVSNIKLTRTDGTIFTYPKAESYFIVDETDVTTHELELSGIPAGDYTS